jgi:hypothetical protein
MGISSQWAGWYQGSEIQVLVVNGLRVELKRHSPRHNTGRCRVFNTPTVSLITSVFLRPALARARATDLLGNRSNLDELE